MNTISANPTQTSNRTATAWFLANTLLSTINFLLIALYWADIPETIPIHFTVGSLVDEFGSKSWLPILAGIGLLLAFLAYLRLKTLAAPPVSEKTRLLRQSLTLGPLIVCFFLLIFTLKIVIGF